MWLIAILIILIFLASLYYYSSSEGFTNNKIQHKHRVKASCPDMLIQDGIKIYLYNSKLAKVPGVNPVEFNNLEEYVEFTKWQRNEKLRCPVLYLQRTFNTQGESTYKMRPSIYDMQGGLPPSINMNNANATATTCAAYAAYAAHDITYTRTISA